jgi:Na+-translocating ferredoxin:NAD+ oxidoreductase subunit G
MKSIAKDAMILTLITLISGLLLGLVYEVTKKPIEQANYNTTQNAYKAVFEDADSFVEYEAYDADEAVEVLTEAGLAEDAQIDSVMEAEDASGEVIGYVISVTDHNGYGGDISFSLGIQNDGTVNGIAFTSISETAGLGQKAKEEKFSSQFNGLSAANAPMEVVKTTPSADNQIEAISGATITSKAVTGGTNAALTYFNEVLGGSAK